MSEAHRIVIAQVIEGRAIIAADCRIDGEQVPQWTRMEDPERVKVALERALAALKTAIGKEGR